MAHKLSPGPSNGLTLIDLFHGRLQPIRRVRRAAGVGGLGISEKSTSDIAELRSRSLCISTFGLRLGELGAGGIVLRFGDPRGGGTGAAVVSTLIG